MSIYVSISKTAPMALFAGTDLAQIKQASLKFSLASVNLKQSFYWPKQNWLQVKYHDDLLNAIRTVQHIQIMELLPNQLNIHQPANQGWYNQSCVKLDPHAHDFDGSTFQQDYQINGSETIQYDSYNLTWANIDPKWIKKFKQVFQHQQRA